MNVPCKYKSGLNILVADYICFAIKPQSSSHNMLQYRQYAAQCGPPGVHVLYMMGLTGRQDKT